MTRGHHTWKAIALPAYSQTITNQNIRRSSTNLAILSTCRNSLFTFPLLPKERHPIRHLLSFPISPRVLRLHNKSVNACLLQYAATDRPPAAGEREGRACTEIGVKFFVNP